jgi:hypothetical protein
MADVDEGFEPVPALTEPASADDELTLEDALADDAAVVVGAEPPVPLGRAPAFDFRERRFAPGLAGGPLMTHGTQTLQTWVEKCIRTRRGESPAVDPDFGLDLLAEDLLEEGVPYDPAAVAEYVAAIERGLTVHPRIASVDDIQVTYDDPDDDGVFVSFTVIQTADDAEELTFDRLSVGG